MTPNVLNPGASSLAVPRLVAITEPMPNTEAPHVYFHCSHSTASFHRQDGKKLPFLNHFYKATFAEDVAYLDNEIRTGNPYIRRATEDEVSHARLLEDPLGTVKDQLKKELSIDDLEKLLAERRAAVASPAVTDGSRIAGVDAQDKNAGMVQAQGVVLHASASGASTRTLGQLLANTKKLG
jgi:hypothetical protein